MEDSTEDMKKMIPKLLSKSIDGNPIPSKMTKGIPAYTANLVIGSSTIKLEIQKSSSDDSIMQEFDQTAEDIEDLIVLLTREKVIGVRLGGKRKVRELLAEKLLKRGIRPIISDFENIKTTNKEIKGLKGMPVINQNVAGIDIGQSLIYVSIPPDRDKDSTRVFESFTSDLEAIVEWFKQNNITSAAMEATGVYWKPLFMLCMLNGINIIVVNPKHVKMLPGRKSDVLDCQWLMRLLACGLLTGGFIPAPQFCALRDLARYRQDLMDRGGDCINRVIKMLEQMNIKLAMVVSNVSGKSGMDIIRAMIGGERDPHKLAGLANEKCKAPKALIAKALVGTYSEECMCIMTSELNMFDHLNVSVEKIELKIKKLLEELPDFPTPMPPQKSKKAKETKRDYSRSPYCFDLRPLLHQKFGCDLTILTGIAGSSAAIILFELGGRVDAFPTHKHFASWNGTSPGTKISGGKKLSGKAPKKFSRVGQALRIAANANAKSQSAAGAFLRSLGKRGKTKLSARKATAHKIGTQVYNMLKYGQQYVEKGAEEFDKAHKARKVQAMKKTLTAMGIECHLTDTETGELIA